MDASNQKDNSPDTIRERIESKRDEFAGGPEPGWQQMEAAAAASQPATGAVPGMASTTGGQAADTAAGNVAVAQGTNQVPAEETAGIPFNEEHPIGIGQQCFKCGAYNEVEADVCWNCSSELSRTAVETPGVVESILPDEEVTPIATPTDTGTTESNLPGGARPIS
jgi:hypothetical protein